MLKKTMFIILSLVLILGATSMVFGGKFKPEQIPLDQRLGPTTPAMPRDKAYCVMQNDNGSIAYYFGGFNAGDGVAAYMDPMTCGVPNPYPFRVTDAHLYLYNFAGSVWPVQIQVNIRDLVGGDSCNGPGTILCSETFTIPVDSAYPRLMNLNISSLCCVNGPFFMEIVYTGGTSSPYPSPLFTNPSSDPSDTCNNWLLYGGVYYEWYNAWTPPVPGNAVIRATGNTQDPDCATTGACCNNDAPYDCQLLTETNCNALPNHTFKGVGTNCGPPNPCLPTPPNDDCANAEPVGDVTNLPFSTEAATFDGPGSCQNAPNIWYCYTATCNGNAHVALCGSSYDTKLAAYDGCACPPTTMLACNDDSCGGTQQSEISFPVVQGQSYLIEVGGYGSATGPGDLSISCEIPPTDVLGDVNGNGQRDLEDVQLILEHVAGNIVLPPWAIAVADVDSNGLIQALDASLVYIMVVIPQPPIVPVSFGQPVDALLNKIAERESVLNTIGYPETDEAAILLQMSRQSFQAGDESTGVQFLDSARRVLDPVCNDPLVAPSCSTVYAYWVATDEGLHGEPEWQMSMALFSSRDSTIVPGSVMWDEVKFVLCAKGVKYFSIITWIAKYGSAAIGAYYFCLGKPDFWGCVRKVLRDVLGPDNFEKALTELLEHLVLVPLKVAADVPVYIPTHLSALAGDANVVIPAMVDSADKEAGILSTQYKILINSSDVYPTTVQLSDTILPLWMSALNTSNPSEAHLALASVIPMIGSGAFSNLLVNIAETSPPDSVVLTLADFLFNCGIPGAITSNGLLIIGRRGDATGDGVIDVGDVVFLINYLFKSGIPPFPLDAGDANCDGVVDVGDVVYLINYLFKNGPPPGC